MNDGHSRPLASRLLVVCLVVTLAVGGGLSLLAGPVGSQSGALFQQDSIAADEVRISVDVRDNGSAAWRISFWRVLDDNESRAAFESLRADIEEDPDSYTSEFATRIETTVGAASNATGREMAADSFTIETDRQSLAREYGVVRYRFEWEGFAAVEGETLAAGDAIEGIYLDDGTRLLISWPAGYDLQSVAPEPDDRRETAVLWEGTRTEFISGEPRVIVTPAATGIGAGTVAAGLVVIAIVAGLGGWLLRRRSDEDLGDGPAGASAEAATEATGDDATGSSTTAATGSSTAATTDATGGEGAATPPPGEAGGASEAEATAADESAAADADPSPDRSADEVATDDDAADSESEADEPATDDATDDGSPATEIDEELLSNEEQVMRLLEANDGRMKQQTVVTELGWTDAKTSKVISGMREAGTIESFRIGRENVLTTPEDDPREPSP